MPFLNLARPLNSAMEDNNYHRYYVKDHYEEQFEQAGLGRSDCTAAAEIEWNPPTGKQYRWGFLRLEVEVVVTELEGPVDLGDLIVGEGTGGGGGDNASSAGVVLGG
ncbi:hypothetical protein N657DRAFT_681461 [Parathielavia appendiculata]|uniref:Uncharacterized protein n=1 Tax=Parathielavia appendiculata TaxID=2587402 RepID=A0AAN6TZ17_9PEZI|nr:hypothetical protein N657DRAFT_681461 [Parathielavia appendiculata]